jgi:hypothetical protein
MAVLEPSAPVGGSSGPAFPAARRLRFRFHPDRDALTISVWPKRPAVSVDLEGEVWARWIPATGEVVGFEIDDFVSEFLTRHPQLAELWNRSRARHRPAFMRSGLRRGFSSAIVQYLREKVARAPVSIFSGAAPIDTHKPRQPVKE